MSVREVDTDTDDAAPQAAPDVRPERPDLVSTALRRVVPLGLLAVLLAILGRVAALPLSNSDTFFHLRFGRELLDSWSLRHPGTGSDLATADWVPTQWLAQELMARVESGLGLAGVAWLSGLQLVTLVVTLYVVTRRGSEPLVAAVVTGVALAACLPGLSMRPQVMSYILVAVTASLWLAARDGARAPWVLVPLTWVWATYHGMWPLGIVVGLVACAGLALDGARGRRLAALLAVPLASAVAAALTPVGPRLYAAVLDVSSRSSYYPEWASPSFTASYGIAVLVLLAIAAVSLLRLTTPTRWTDLALLAVGAGFAVYSMRTVPVAAAVLAPLAAGALQRLVGPRPAVRWDERAVLWGGAVLTLAVLALAVPHTADRPLDKPEWSGIGALDDLPPGTRILDESVDGGYLMWARPDLDVFMHGYGDVFTDAELERNADIESVQPGWLGLVRQTGARYAWLTTTAPLDDALRLQGWTVVDTVRSPRSTVELLAAPADW